VGQKKKIYGTVEEIGWFPAAAGKLRAYASEYPDGAEWKRVPTRKVSCGVPYPFLFGGVLSEIGLMGYGRHSPSPEFKPGAEVRLQEYEVLFDLKARKV